VADRVDVKLTAITPLGVKSTTNINYANPEATNSTLKALAQRLNQLTQNTYSQSDKVETTNLDFAPGGGIETPTLTLAATSETVASLKTKLNTGATWAAFPATTITYDGDGQLSASLTYDSTDSSKFLGVSIMHDSSRSTTSLIVAGKADYAFPCTITIRAAATDTYKAAEVTYTITE